MKPDINGYEVVYLRTGEGCFTNKPLVVSTVLGSCVAITMFSEKPRFAGIVHCQLPVCLDKGLPCKPPCDQPFKYVECSIPKMLEKFKRMKVKTKDIEVKIFGGGEIIQSANGIINGKARDIRVGAQNVAAAIKLLEDHSLRITASDTGGSQGRKLLFFANTGEIFLNRLKNNG